MATFYVENQIYTLKIKDFPWSDAWAAANQQDDLWTENTARYRLDDLQARIQHINRPIAHVPKSFGGDKNIPSFSGTWVWVVMTAGPINGQGLWVAIDWIVESVSPPVLSTVKVCCCSLKLILAKGCQCGGA